ncbi:MULTISPECIES: type IV pilus biogenesis/stability protein PilW [unclassified Pseudomonas]|uniref:type IV pilus biogenesis/stability protein PilW n=1 Tax=unclassified Pseudomonas TaxID=196821 RepID=UPI000BCF12B1|nr:MULTISPECIES: type IV pilus biogenesis/stability protein PilW [unclassified Pseudomonas]PVZ12460.1 type IV pilus assembly protein PilF [Pseudomonas sp. URIL14HWK12:I12]PVZ23388.1 type IV pilus assembly protein PilF [Pseudomonas sp. URIL14HWK12:I10]PVZ32718.1 type IV pilus assembly protein PilF [Pseudomonas sp. URIL14HWK12:I11]SNZ13892.1 type IV pilus assembly protein PilF [Pseudomonas sp. URIL14HWK12:I9]
MTLRAALLLLLVCLLPGCVTSGKVNPMDTQKGRNEARDAFVQLGLGYLMQGDTERAKVPLKNALDLDPSSQDANAALALVFQAEREPKLAEEYFRKALASGENARIRNNYGSFLYEQKRYPEAYEMFQKAAGDPLYPERSRVFENLGMAAQQLNRPDEAQGWLEKAIAMNGQQPRALLELAEIAYDRKQFVPSRDYFQRFSQLSEQNARSLLLGIRLAKVFEDKNTAASYGLQLKRLYPGTPEYQQYLSEH